MGLVVDTANSPYEDETRLVSLKTVKLRLGISSTQDDKLLSGLLDEATGLIESFVGRKLTEEAYTESIPGNARKYIVLEQSPIVGLTSALYQGTAVTDVVIHDEKAGVLFREENFTRTSSIYSNLSRDHLNGYENVDWVFNYLAGFRIEGEEAETGEFGPNFALSALAYRSFMHLYGSRRRDLGLVSRKVDGIEEVYVSDPSGSSGLPVSVENGLAPFRRWS